MPTAALAPMPSHCYDVGDMLQLKNIRKAYGAIVAMDGLTLSIRQGEVFGPLGPNGAGKTTTVNMAVGLACFCIGTKAFRWTEKG